MIRKYQPSKKIQSNLDFLKDYYDSPPLPLKTKEGESYTSDRYLNVLLKNNAVEDVCEVSRLSHINLTSQQKSLLYNTLAEEYPSCSILLSGHFFYPENGYMSWHTNNKAPGLRLYLSYTEHEGKSFFKYRKNDKIIKDSDMHGWTAREFKIDQDNLLWHSVYAEKPRISIGFRIIKNLL
jgi:hypothetical protein